MFEWSLEFQGYGLKWYRSGPMAGKVYKIVFGDPSREGTWGYFIDDGAAEIVKQTMLKCSDLCSKF